MTPFAAFGYWYYRKGWYDLARWSLLAYCLMSLLVLGHYLILPPWKVSTRINLFILLEVIAAAWLMLHVLMSAGPKVKPTTATVGSSLGENAATVGNTI